MGDERNRVRPLRVRPGARFACFGDGLCCADVHALGSLTRREVRMLRLIADEAVVHRPDLGAHVLQVGSSGRCVFREPEGCALHARLGVAAKPGSCSRYPFGLTATPSGGRITTSHRCPCRTLGDRPPVTTEGAAPSLVDAAGRLWAERRLHGSVAIEGRRRVPFARWEAYEAELLTRLAAGVAPEAVLDRAPLSELAEGSWPQVGYDLAAEVIEPADPPLSRFDVATAWFASALIELSGDEAPIVIDRGRPWADAFDRAEARSRPGDPLAIYADWIADAIWDLGWVAHGSFARARADLATRLAIARRVDGWLRTFGVRPDRAAAEAVMVVESVGLAPAWSSVIRRMAA